MKKILRKIPAAFGNLPMTWPVVCIFAAAIGVYVGIINQIPILNNTSFQDIAVTLEWWVLFAILIVSNCKSALESGLKCIVFFLISQPIIYILELPTIGLQTALSYWLNIWLPITFLTLPGGAIAFFAKKQNALGAVILSIGNTIVALMAASYSLKMYDEFPRHLLTVVSCVAIIAVTIFGMQKKWWTRLLSLATTVLLTTSIILFTVLSGRVL